MTTISADYCMLVNVWVCSKSQFKAGSGRGFSFGVRANRSGALKACMCYK